jgi:hypothetical protein
MTKKFYLTIISYYEQTSMHNAYAYSAVEILVGGAGC